MLMLLEQQVEADTRSETHKLYIEIEIQYLNTTQFCTTVENEPFIQQIQAFMKFGGGAKRKLFSDSTHPALCEP